MFGNRSSRQLSRNHYLFISLLIQWELRLCSEDYSWFSTKDAAWFPLLFRNRDEEELCGKHVAFWHNSAPQPKALNNLLPYMHSIAYLLLPSHWFRLSSQLDHSSEKKKEM